MSNKKKINEDAVFSELTESKFFRPSPAQDDNTAINNADSEQTDKSADPLVDKSVDKSGDPPVDESTGQPVRRSRSRATKRSTGHSANPSPILGRPKSFYITQKHDKELDILVDNVAEELEGKIHHKIDRSTIIRLLLDAQDLSEKHTAKQLAKQLVNELVSQLVD